MKKLWKVGSPNEDISTRDSTQTPVNTVEGVPSGTWWQRKDIERYEDIGRTPAIRNYISHLSLVNRLFLNIDPLLVRL